MFLVQTSLTAAAAVPGAVCVLQEGKRPVTVVPA